MAACGQDMKGRTSSGAGCPGRCPAALAVRAMRPNSDFEDHTDAPTARVEAGAESRPGKSYFTTYGSRPRKRARLIALASSRCFFWLTAVMRDGTILPRSEM